MHFYVTLVLGKKGQLRAMEMKTFTAHKVWPKGVRGSLNVRTKCCTRTISKWETDLEGEVTEFVNSKYSTGVE